MVKVIALLKRKPGITKGEFNHRWMQHTKLAALLPGLRGYRINLATPRQPEGTGDEPIYDGTAELWWDISVVALTMTTPVVIIVICLQRYFIRGLIPIGR